MSVATAVWLGLVQALTEFLPVSSSGHLRLAQGIFGWEEDADLLFDLLLHVGTLAAVVAVYAADLAHFARDAVRGLRGPGTWRERLDGSEGLQMALCVVVATIPTAVMGLLLKPLLSGGFFTVPMVGGLLLVNGVWLRLSKRGQATTDPAGPDSADAAVGRRIGWKQAFWIGCAQGVAVLPGISRSGATIVTALLLGTRRMDAARFSFLLSIPAILGATVLEFDAAALREADAPVGAYIVGVVTAAVVGVVALRLLLRLLREARFSLFSWYCWAVGAGALLWALWPSP